MEDRRIDGKLEQMWMRLENWKFGFSLCEWMENWKSSSTIRYDGRLYYTTMRITQIQHTYYACVEMAYGRSHSTTDLAENIQINNSKAAYMLVHLLVADRSPHTRCIGTLPILHEMHRRRSLDDTTNTGCKSFICDIHTIYSIDVCCAIINWTQRNTFPNWLTDCMHVRGHLWIWRREQQQPHRRRSKKYK